MFGTYSWTPLELLHPSLFTDGFITLHRERDRQYRKQESIPVGCIPPACQPYVFRWPPLIVNRILDTCLWKHYLPQTSFAGGNNGPVVMGPGPCVGTVWISLHNIVKPIDPIPGPSPITMQCEYTISVNSLSTAGRKLQWNLTSSILDHFVTDTKLLWCKDRDKVIHLNGSHIDRDGLGYRLKIVQGNQRISSVTVLLIIKTRTRLVSLLNYAPDVFLLL